MARRDWSKTDPVVGLRVTRAEQAQLRALAKAHGTSVSGLLRELVTDHLRTAGPAAPPTRSTCAQGELPLTG